MAERDGLKLGELVAAAGAAEKDRELVTTSLQQRLIKTGGPLAKHARYSWLLLAESGLTRRLFGAMVRAGLPPLPVATGWAEWTGREKVAARAVGLSDGDAVVVKEGEK